MPVSRAVPQHLRLSARHKHCSVIDLHIIYLLQTLSCKVFAKSALWSTTFDFWIHKMFPLLLNLLGTFYVHFYLKFYVNVYSIVYWNFYVDIYVNCLYIPILPPGMSTDVKKSVDSTHYLVLELALKSDSWFLTFMATVTSMLHCPQ